MLSCDCLLKAQITANVFLATKNLFDSEQQFVARALLMNVALCTQP